MATQRVVISVVGNTRQANRALAGTQKRVRGLGQTARRTRGRVGSLRTNLSGLSSTAGLAQASIFQLSGSFLAAGGLVLAMRAAIKAAAEFEAAMTKINVLVGISREQTALWAREILQLAPALGRGPKELAEALFVVTSAGERGADALRIVERAAKASAIGLGETKTVARAVVAAMQAYKKSGLDAATATDVLVATVREGNLEADQLAGSLGRVLGVAADAGVTFQEVGGFIATFTRVGVSAQEAVTALRSTLNLIGKPSQDARDALAEMGVTIQEVRRSVGERGLAKTLVELVAVLQQDEEALRRVFPNMRALAGVLANASSQAEEFITINESLANSLGITERGFETVSKEAAFVFQAARAQLGVFLIQIGQELLPQITEMVAGLVELAPKMNRVAVIVGAMFNTVLSLVRVVANSITFVFDLLLLTVISAAQGIITIINEVFIDPINAAIRLTEKWRGVLAAMPGSVGRQARLMEGITFQLGRIAPLTEAQRIAWEMMKEDAFDINDAIGKIGSSWANVALTFEGIDPLIARMAFNFERMEKASGALGAGVAGAFPGRVQRAFRPPGFGTGDAGTRLGQRMGRETAKRFFAPFLAEAQMLVEQSIPAAEQYRRSMTALDVALRAGSIGATQHAQAVAFLRSQYETSTRSFAELATTVGPAVASLIAQVIRAARGGGGGGALGFLSSVLGAAAGVAAMIPGGQLIGAGLLAGSLVTGALAGGREQPVRISSFGPRAMQQQREIQVGPDKVIVQIFSPSTGELVEELVYLIDRRTRTDSFERIPRFVGSGAIAGARDQTVFGG